MRFGIRFIKLSLLVLTLTLLLPITTALATGNSNPGVLPPNSHAFGKTYGQWSATWWQWAFASPTDNNPLFDETGAKCGVGQSGPVWFLAGVFNTTGSASRTCVIPAGKALFFPILNAECDNYWPANSMSLGELRAQCKGFIDPVVNLSAAIDGKSITGLAATSAYRVTSPVFDVRLPDNNIQQVFGFDAPAGVYTGLVADGVYLMLSPLSAGEHTLHFHGEVPGFALDITYHLTVKE